MNKEGCVFVGD